MGLDSLNPDAISERFKNEDPALLQEIGGPREGLEYLMYVSRTFTPSLLRSSKLARALHALTTGDKVDDRVKDIFSPILKYFMKSGQALLATAFILRDICSERDPLSPEELEELIKLTESLSKSPIE